MANGKYELGKGACVGGINIYEALRGMRGATAELIQGEPLKPIQMQDAEARQRAEALEARVRDMEQAGLVGEPLAVQSEVDTLKEQVERLQRELDELKAAAGAQRPGRRGGR